MILTHMVTLENYCVDFRPFEFHKQNYMHISSKILSVAYPGLEIKTVMSTMSVKLQKKLDSTFWDLRFLIM